MSRLTRRDALKVGAIASAALATPLGAAALHRRTVVLFDSRLPESLAFARSTAGVGIDLSGEHGARFATVRSGMPKASRIEALARWSDFVPLRRELERQGFRLTAESRAGSLIRWSMAGRSAR